LTAKKGYKKTATRTPKINKSNSHSLKLLVPRSLHDKVS